MYLENFIAALEELKNGVDAMSCTSAIVDSFPGGGHDGYAWDGTLRVGEIYCTG